MVGGRSTMSVFFSHDIMQKYKYVHTHTAQIASHFDG